MKRENQAYNRQSLAHIKSKFEEKTGVELQKKHAVRTTGRLVTAAAVVLLCLVITTSALAMEPSEVYALLYAIAPKTAQFFKPVELTSVDQGIEVQVVSAYIHDASASVMITVRDLESDRLDRSLDLYDSYEINTGFDSVGYCKQIDYDETTNTATFLITIESMDEADVIAGEKVTFSLTTLLAGKSELFDLPVAIDWDAIDSSPDVESADPYEGNVLAIGETMLSASDGFDVTGLGYVDGTLHVQLYTPGRHLYDDHAFLRLKNGNGETIEADMIYRGGYTANNPNSGFRADHVEYAFDVPQEELSKYSLFGDFIHAEKRVDGNWSVTFPLEIED